jgi:hypothetical protein
MAKGTQFKDFLWYLAISVLAFPMVPLFDHLGKPEFERPAAFELGLMLLVVKVCRDVRGRPWFWITIIAIAALHVPLLMLTAQGLTRAPFAEMLLLSIVDITGIFAVVRLIERLIGSREAPIPAVSGSPKSHL